MALTSDWILDPLAPWHYVATAVAVLAILMLLARGLFDGWHSLGSTPLWRIGVILLSTIAIALLVLAAWNPVKIKEPDPGLVHLSVVVDVSDSVQRADGGWEAVQQQAQTFLSQSMARIPEEFMTDGEASLITFRGKAREDSSTLVGLLSDFAGLGAANFASGEGTDLGEGLERAARAIGKSGRRGAILLISDGHDTEEAVPEAVDLIAQQGIPVTVFPVESGEPELAISSADLAGRIHAGEETQLRGVIYNHTTDLVSAGLTVAENQGLETDEVGPARPFSGTVSEALPDLAPGQYARLRMPVTFEGKGLQYLDLALQDDKGATTHRRRLFSHIERPVELLVIGGDFAWLEAVSADAIHYTQKTVAEISQEIDLTPYDGIVISSVSFEEFDERALDKIKSAVEEEGLGLMLINGDHDGADEETPTVLRSYHETDFEPVLPLSTEPRPLEEEPPTRHVIIMLDTSGSMHGWQLQKAVETIQYIINDHLTRNDFLDLIILGGYQVINEQQMHDAGKAQAIGHLSNLPGGASELHAALELLRDRNLSNCGLVVISDGEISGGDFRPDCRVTIFAVNQSVPANSPLHELGDPFVVDQSFSPSQISIPYFEPEKRDKFFEEGSFEPLSIETAVRQSQPLPVPEIPLEGAAISYPKKATDVLAFRPKFADPILAYGPAGNGYTGIFTTGFTKEWIETEEGRQTIQEWLLRIVPYAARDRYSFSLEDDGSNIDLTLSVQNQDGPIPDVDAVEVHVEIGDTLYNVPMPPDSFAPATYGGVMKELPRGDTAQLATLIVDETGPDELARAQRIPFIVPPAGTIAEAGASEAMSYGVNQPLLETITEMTGGEYDPQGGAAFFRQPPDDELVLAIWPWLVAAGALFYLLAIMLRRLDG